MIRLRLIIWKGRHFAAASFIRPWGPYFLPRRKTARTRVEAETKAYKPIPVITDFAGGDGKDHMREEIERNYYRIKEEVGGIIQKELRRIENDPNLKHLLETEDDG